MSEPPEDPRLLAAAAAAQSAAGDALDRLRDSDLADLVAAFHRAEALAAAALEAAIGQVDESYRRELREQLDDEARHVDVFAGWLTDPRLVTPPRSRKRPTSVWLLLLLTNELAGYCQFHMLLALLGDEGRCAQVAEILADERRHIARLARWLEPFWSAPEAAVLHDVAGAFRRGLPGRMHQFFSRSELGPLRSGMAAVCADLLEAYLPPRAAVCVSDRAGTSPG